MMLKGLSKEFRVGLVSILTFGLVYWGFNFVKGNSIFQTERIYYAVYDDIDGLNRARPVNLNGLQIGTIKETYLHPDASGKVIVKMIIANDVAISKDTKAEIYTPDFIGGKSVKLILGQSSELTKTGDTLKSTMELSIKDAVNAQVAPLRAKAEEMIGSIDTVLTLVQGFLNEDTRNTFLTAFSSIQNSFVLLEKTLVVVNSSVTETQGDFEEIMANMASITANLKNNGENFDSIFNNVSSLTDSLAKIEFTKTFASLNNTLLMTEEVMNKINTGEGTLGLLVNDTALYYNLERSTEQLNKLLLDVKYNPKRYVHFSVFGKSKEYSEQEIEDKESEAQAKKKDN